MSYNLKTVNNSQYGATLTSDNTWSGTNTFSATSNTFSNGITAGSIKSTGGVAFNASNNGSLLLSQTLINVGAWSAIAPSNAGLQIGWNNKEQSNTGRVDFLCNGQGAGGGFDFWTMCSTSPTPFLIASINSFGVQFNGSTLPNITVMNTAISTAVSTLMSGTNIFTGVCNTVQSADTILPITFTTAPSFSMTSGMVYYLTTTSTAMTSLGFTNIPTTPQQTYVFSFVLLPSVASSAWYLKPPTNYLSITAVGGTVNTAVPLYGISNVVLPASYTYLFQQITIVNTSTTTTPSFISFLSVGAY